MGQEDYDHVRWPRVFYLIATEGRPRTITQISNKYDMDRDSVNQAVHNLYREGFLIRRKQPNEKPGHDPYAYDLKPRRFHDWEGEDSAE